MTDNDDLRQDTGAAPDGDDFAASKAILRLLVGLTLEGTDELSRRLREWEDRITQEAAPTPPDGSDAETLTDGDRLYYALIGMAFAARQRVENDLMGWLVSPSRAMQGMIDAADQIAQNPLLRPLVKPLKEQAEQLSTQMHGEIERWIAIGQAEEQRSRAIARTAVPEIVDEVLESLADNPELQDLIQQQSVGLAGEVVDSVREVTVTADAVMEGIVRRLLRRRPRNQLPAPDKRLLPEPSQNGHKGPYNDDHA